jgi:hypothetical protein
MKDEFPRMLLPEESLLMTERHVENSSNQWWSAIRGTNRGRKYTE